MNLVPYPKNIDNATKWDFKFWSTQPVTKLNENIIVDTDSGITNTLQDSLPDSLPENFEWKNYNLSDLGQRTKILVFLNKFYGTDINNEFSKQYSENYLEFISNNRTYVAVGVEHKDTIIGFIYGFVTKTQVNRKQLDLVEVSLLCIHSKLRYKRLTPKLILELKRQFNVLGYNYGTFSTVNYVAKPFTSSIAFNRIISAKILIDTEFVKLDKTITLESVKKVSFLPDKPSHVGFKKMEESHVDQAFDLFTEYIQKYNYHPIYTKDSFKMEFYNNKFINTYVMTDKNGNVTDFISYYTLNVTVLKKNQKYKNIKRGYLYYYTCVNSTPYKLLQNVLIMAKKYGTDVFTALDNMENTYVLKELGFDESPTTYHLYTYNFKIPNLQNVQVAKTFL